MDGQKMLISIHHLLGSWLPGWTSFCHLYAYELGPVHHNPFLDDQCSFSLQ